ncbi:MAG: hypothetical protein KatS3mg129_2093 [Leptospiraceae bacterium]|nr:MAG: hypothetical protein KatS3mg129_2093 [Leptospiraceae bacterium]
MIDLKYGKRKVINYRGNRIVVGGLTSKNKIDILLYILRNLINTSTEKELWDQTVFLCKEIFEPDYIYIYLVEFQKKMNSQNGNSEFQNYFQLIRKYSRENQDFDTEEEKNNDKILQDKPYIFQVFKDNQALLINDLRIYYKNKKQKGSVICVPIKYQNSLLGIISLESKISYFYKKDDLEILTALASQIGLIIKQVELLQNLYTMKKQIQYDLKIAKKIQQLIIHSHYLPWNGIHFFHHYEPMSEISGDYYRIFRNENFLLIFLCDVSGHGIPASMITLVIHQLLESIIQKTDQLQDILVELNEKIIPYLPDGVYFTAQILKIYANYDFEFINGGQTPVLYFSYKDAQMKELDGKGLPLGIAELERENLELVTGNFMSGDVLIFYTDGFYEQKNKDRIQFGLDRLKNTFLMECKYFQEKNQFINPEQLVLSFFTIFDEFASSVAQEDDRSMIIVSFSTITYNILNRLYKKNKELKEKDFYEIYKLEKSLIKNLYLASLYYLKNKNYDRALFYIEEYIKYIQPKNYLIYLYAGFCYFKLKDYKKTREYLRIVLAKQPENEKAIRFLIQSYLNDNQIEKANYYYQQFGKKYFKLDELYNKK